MDNIDVKQMAEERNNEIKKLKEDIYHSKEELINAILKAFYNSTLNDYGEYLDKVITHIYYEETCDQYKVNEIVFIGEPLSISNINEN